MKSDPHADDATLESDPVWRLLAGSPAAQARTRFADDMLRAARLSGAPRRWWSTVVSPVPLTALAGAVAALVFAILAPQSGPAPSASIADPHADVIDEIAETEMLIAAADHPEHFSDAEILALCGF